MVESLNRIVLTLLEATLTLYPANSDGTPDTSSPLWTGVKAERVEIHERWETAQTRSSGAKFPKRHPIVQTYEVTVGRVWALPLSELDGFVPGRNERFVLDLTWRDEDAYPDGAGQWHRRTFYGVTLGERSLESREIDSGHTETQVFNAESQAVASGTGNVEVLSEDILRSYIVRYVDASGARTDLYAYDRVSHNFTALVPSPGALATVGYVPDQTGVFQVTFAGAEWSALRVRADGTMEGMKLLSGAPKRSDVPRVEFWYGPIGAGQRFMSVTAAGRVYAHGFRAQSIIPKDEPSYLLSTGSGLNAAIGADVFAKAFEEFVPSNVTGLKGWWAVEDLKNHAVARVGGGLTIDLWPNRVSAGPALTPALGTIFYLPHGNDLFIPPLEGDGLAAVLLDKDSSAYLVTSATLVQGFDHCVFVVAKPGQRDGISGHGDMAVIGTGSPALGDASADGSWVLALENFKLEGNIWTDDGATRKNTTGATDVGTQLMQDEAWLLLEGEMRSTGAGSLTVRRNGVQEGTTALTGTLTDADVLKRVYVGAPFAIQNGSGGFTFQRGSLDGLLRSVVVYEGQLTNENKARVRQYLNLQYEIY